MTKDILIKNELRPMTFDEVYTQFENLLHNRVHKWRTYIETTTFIDEDDLLQIARIELWNAYMTYDASRGYKFITWACVRIDGALKRNYRDIYIRKYHRKGAQVKGICSLQDVVISDDKPVCREDCIADENSEQFIDDYCLQSSIKKLDKEYRDVIYQRFYKGMTTTAIGKANGYSQVKASRMVVRAVKRLKAIMA